MAGEKPWSFTQSVSRSLTQQGSDFLCCVFGFPCFNEIRYAVKCAHLLPHDRARLRSKQLEIVLCLMRRVDGGEPWSPSAVQKLHPASAPAFIRPLGSDISTTQVALARH